MATLIPSQIADSVRTPLSERELHASLKCEDRVSGTWTVLHSLDIRWHTYKLEGEADFLVLAPGLGVMVVEVKGCDVSRSNGIWKYHYRNPKTTSEGPFKQSRSAMHSLRSWLHGKGNAWLDQRKLSDWKRWAWHSCVVFTSIDFDLEPTSGADGPEWTVSEVVSRRDVERYGIAACLANALKGRHHELAKIKRDGVAGAAWYDANRSRPSTEDIGALVQALRPDFFFEGEAWANIQRLEKAISDATEEQARIAFGILENRRIILKGAAGTGKTYVAVRLARYWAKSGLRVGFICFNNLLARWLERELSVDFGRHSYVGTFSKLMLDIAEEKVPAQPSSIFWEGLTKRAEARLLEQVAPPQFDVLVVDEAQDLLREEMVDLLDLLLEDGLKEGRWIFAGDFSGQAIYSSDSSEEELLQRLESKGIAQMTQRMGVNCRNAVSVMESIQLLSNPEIRYESILNTELKGDFTPHFVGGDDTAKQSKLHELVLQLRKRFSPEQIVVLSTRARDSTAEQLVSRVANVGLRKLSGPVPDKGSSGFATIHAFKGLDASVVIVTDVDSFLDTESNALFYTGISRGKQEVHVIFDVALKQQYRAKVLG